MSDAMWIEGKEYVSSKRASQLSGYSQDYIGQLARKSLIGAERVGGLWFVSLPSLTEYKSNADKYVPLQPERKSVPDADSLVSFDGKDHVSASRAAEITGYHPDYVGQLARSGAVVSRQVGNRWYIDRGGILAHKREKDSLLGAVQAQSVGLAHATVSRDPLPRATSALNDADSSYSGAGPLLTYTRDDRDLVPVLLAKLDNASERQGAQPMSSEEESLEGYTIPIRVLPKKGISHQKDAVNRVKMSVRVPAKTIYYKTFRGLAAAAFTVVIVLTFGFVTLKNSSVYTANTTHEGVLDQKSKLTAGAAGALQWAGRFLENFLVKELVYRRAQ